MSVSNGRGDSEVHKYLMNEGPMIIGTMSAVIEGGGSLDTAVRDVAKKGPVHARKMFEGIVFNADTRVIPDIKAGLTDMISTLPQDMSSFRRSMHMVIAASESGDQNERERMLNDASGISLSGLKDAGDKYGSSLNLPCMVVFGLGIMVPMVLMSILPMLNMGGMFGGSPVNPDMISIMTLVIIPSIIMLVAFSVKEKNPFISSIPNDTKPQHLVPFIMAVPLTVLLFIATSDICLSVMVSMSVSGVMTYILTYPESKVESERSKQELGIRDSMFELGNSLISGMNFENALSSAISVRKECRSLAESIKTEAAMSRGDVCSAIRMSVGEVSKHMSDIFCDIYGCAQKDIRDAGRLAISMGRQLQDQDAVHRCIGNKLKSMVDMMSGTAMVFAPLVLGMSVSMLKPLAEMTGGSGTEDVILILVAYLVELSVLISFMTSYLGGDSGRMSILRRVSMTVPVSMAVFAASTSISL